MNIAIGNSRSPHAACPALAALLLTGVAGAVPPPAPAPDIELPADFVASALPADITSGSGNARDVKLEQAAIFAWRQFIALNWPAATGGREKAATGPLDDGSATRVWETMRGRVEAYPGQGEPNGYATDAADYGYDAPPDYVYAADVVGTPDGRIPACDGKSPSRVPPWHNLDEKSNQIRSGLSRPEPFPGQNVLLESKINRQNYVYIASRGWYGRESTRMAARRTGNYVRTNLAPPRAASVADDPDDTEYISFPNDTIELKAAWRRLGPHDRPSRFFRSQVRYYAEKNGKPCHVDSDRSGGGKDGWGLLALHIVRKTPSAPYFIWATFEQVDALVAATPGADGHAQPTESPDGTPIPGMQIPAETYSPDVKVVAATEQTEMSFDPASLAPASDPGLRLHFHQQALYDIPEIRYVSVNRRMHPIPDEIRAVNRVAQAALRARAPTSPLQHYRLVALQWRPMTKAAGKPYDGPEPAVVYYASNVIIEAPPVHQAFSGQFTHGVSKASDYLRLESRYMNPPPNPGEPVFNNTYHAGKAYLSGGCMGCHGERQAYGTDWSFLLFRQRVKAPVMPTP